jgi:hypothetical protein
MRSARSSASATARSEFNFTARAIAPRAAVIDHLGRTVRNSTSSDDRDAKAVSG